MGQRYLKFEVALKNGLADGEAKSYHPNGALFVQQKFKNGFKDGLGKQFNDKGQPWAEFSYVKGRLDGDLTLFTQDTGNLPKGVTTFKDGRVIEKIAPPEAPHQENLGKPIKISPKTLPLFCGWKEFTEDHSYADGGILQYKKGVLQFLRITGEGEIHETIFQGKPSKNSTEASLTIVGTPYNASRFLPEYEGSILIRVYEATGGKTFHLFADGAVYKKPVLFKKLSRAPFEKDDPSVTELYSLDYRKDLPFTDGLKNINLKCNLKKMENKK